MVEPVPSPQKTKPRKSPVRAMVWAAVAVGTLGVVVAGLGVGAALFTSAGSSLERKDFATDASAAAFVSEHLPVPLPETARVIELRYDRFTDWHLESRIDVGSQSVAESYWQRARSVRQLNEAYCGAESSGEVAYFIPAWHACGSIRPGKQPNEFAVLCYTR